MMRLLKTFGTKWPLHKTIIRPACSKASSAALAHVELNKDSSNPELNPQIFCINQVKKYDRENYLAALFIKDLKLRRAVFALRAFNVQLSLVRDSTTNSDRAKLRFQFWAKLIEEIVRRDKELDVNIDKQKAYYSYSPLAKELLDLFILINVDDEIKGWLEDLIGSRVSSKILGYTPIKSMKELELYCTKSNSSIYNLSWTCAQQLNNIFYSNYNIIDTVRKVANALGTAHGLSNVIRGIQYNGSQGGCYIPKDIIIEHQLSTRDFTTKHINGYKISPVVRVLALRCQQLLDEAFSDIRFMPNYFRVLFLPRVAIQDNLNRLARCDYNICDQRLASRNELLPLNFWLSSKYFRAPIF